MASLRTRHWEDETAQKQNKLREVLQEGTIE